MIATLTTTANSTLDVREEEARRRTSLRVAVEALPSPIGVLSTFRVRPGAEGSWLEVWEELASVAGALPGCRRFELLRDRSDSSQFSVLSEWDDIELYRRFIRRANLVWIERMFLYLFQETDCTVYDILAGDARERAIRQM